MKSYTGHENTQFCINAVFYKQFVISGSENGIICFWDLQSRELVHSLKSHEGVVSYIGISSELNILVSASTQDMVVNVWDLNQIVDAIGAN